MYHTFNSVQHIALFWCEKRVYSIALTDGLHAVSILTETIPLHGTNWARIAACIDRLVASNRWQDMQRTSNLTSWYEDG